MDVLPGVVPKEAHGVCGASLDVSLASRCRAVTVKSWRAERLVAACTACFFYQLENYNLCLLCAEVSKRAGSGLHSPVVRTCHPAPLSSPSGNNLQSPS